MSFERVKPVLRLPEAIARQIEELICRGQLKPDEMLPAENELMKQFGVGRNTVREALRMLESSGLLKVKQGPRGGSMITPITDTVASEFLVKAFRVGGVSALDFYDFRMTIEPSLVEMLARRGVMDKDLVARAEENIAEAKARYDSGEITAYLNMDFHVILAEATKNMIFIVVLKTLRAAFETVAPPDKEGFRLETIRAHEGILEAIKNRDPSGAKRLMETHLAQMAEVVRLDAKSVEQSGTISGT